MLKIKAVYDDNISRGPSFRKNMLCRSTDKAVLVNSSLVNSGEVKDKSNIDNEIKMNTVHSRDMKIDNKCNYQMDRVDKIDKIDDVIGIDIGNVDDMNTMDGIT